MGCFIGCFGTERDLKRRKHKINHQSQRNKVEILENVNRESSIATGEHVPSDLVSELGDKSERNGEVIPSPRLSPSLSPRKRVTFDTNVTTYEHVLVNESVGSLPEHNTNVENECQEDDDDDDDDSVITTVGLYPPNHRYHNARDSDDDEYDSYSESDIDELDDEDEELNEKDEAGLETNLVLNPVENIIQWKAAKLKGTTVIPLKAQKENQEITAIDASLSNWLVSPKKNTTCIEDRPILGALTVEETRHNSVYSSPKKVSQSKP